MYTSDSQLRSLTTAACAAALLLGACNRAPETTSAPAPGATPANALADPAATQATLAAQTQAAQSWEPSALDELLAPIALYPDALVGQILAASTNAQEVLDAGNWLLDNQDLKGKELDAATEKLGFSPAVRSLVQFPSVVDMMCSQLDWTREVGQAFTADQKGVLDSIQRLRSQAAAVGNLQSTPQQKVEKTTDEGKEVIVVQPADPKVVYVPQYDPQVVYATPPPAPTTTTVVQEGHSTGDMVAAGLMGFTAGIILNEAFDDNDDYYYPHWGGGPAYYPPPYRPVYPGYRPAGAYVRPPNYRHSYNSIGNDVNINVDNDNYFNRVTNNSRAVNSNKVNANQYRGSTSYAGAQNRASDRNVGANANTRAAANEYKGARDKVDPGAAPGEYKGARDKADQRAAPGEYKGARDKADQRAPTGDHRSGNAEQRAASAAGASNHQPRADRGFEPAGAATHTRDNKPNASVAKAPKPPASSGALSNVSRGGKEQAASQRGHQSAGNHARKKK